MSRNRLGSTNSIHSNAGSVPRVNTVTNVLRRFFSREDSRAPNTPDGKINRLIMKISQQQQQQLILFFI